MTFIIIGMILGAICAAALPIALASYLAITLGMMIITEIVFWQGKRQVERSWRYAAFSGFCMAKDGALMGCLVILTGKFLVHLVHLIHMMIAAV